MDEMEEDAVWKLPELSDANEKLVLVDSMKQKLCELEEIIGGSGSTNCVLLEGCSGSGKSTLLKYFSKKYGHVEGCGLTTIHLGEQIDAKLLLGSITCSTIPGEFVWKPGVLMKAIVNGEWVILEDVDMASPDVLSLLLPLVKRRQVVLQGYSDPIKCSPGFFLFATRAREEGRRYASPLLDVLQQHTKCVQLKKLSSDELKQIVDVKYPSLCSYSEKLVATCLSLGIHIRHLLKLCNRIHDHVDAGRVSSVDDLMLELIDCFAGYLPLEQRQSHALDLRVLCGGMLKEKVEYLCGRYKSSVQFSVTTLSIGRAYLHCERVNSSSVCYAHTRHSLNLLESVCRCVQMNEPVLLVGETGVGKTAAVNYLAHITGNKLVVLNMSQQSDSADLLGGFKPVQMAQFVAPVRENFEKLFHDTFSVSQNVKFLTSIQACFVQKKWTKLFKLMDHSLKSALKRLEGPTDVRLFTQWKEFSVTLKKLQQQFCNPKCGFAFAFVEGALVEAIRHGWWILLDEINLATPETLQCLSSLLEDSKGTFILTEKLDSKLVDRSPNFRIFCCMNPATDTGKKSLPFSIRNRLTEFFVDEMQDDADFRLLVLSYFRNSPISTKLIDDIVSLYRKLKDLSENRLQDGTGRKPHYSLRTLCRALHFAATNSCGTLLRSLFEGFCMSFLTQLRLEDYPVVMKKIQSVLGVPLSCISAPIPPPKDGGHVFVEGFWISVGSEAPFTPENYILTTSVTRNLRNLARVVSAKQHPVLLQGPTSAGKTSLIEYLAKKTGHKCLRINNHEHTDLQEYVGMYTAGSDGHLVFQEGLLVGAMRKGYWILLDELNLAPTDVLEALNRVLDDNRELFIPETQTLVKAHPHFLLFGTQNPTGVYGGRKVLSRAFRNRFVELHYDDIPSNEVITILEKKCLLPQKYAEKMVAIMKELQERRSVSGIFSGKYGLITMRDMFRWAMRYTKSNFDGQFYDWEQQLADDGYMLLAGRLRDSTEDQVILEVIEKHMKRRVDINVLFGYDGGSGSLASSDALQAIYSCMDPDFVHLVWTPEMLRMAVLVYRALQFNEPVLLVGNTGCGKTTLCQLVTSFFSKKLLCVNCHMHTEASDFLGGLRPARKKHQAGGASGLFEWVDGILVEAMQEGSHLLIDEISLADDAVLERLNSVLESDRKLLIPERGKFVSDDYQVIATDGFQLLATMNPGGDYGKKELSPALRNRFVEIWCHSVTSREGYSKLLEHNLFLSAASSKLWIERILDFIDWLKLNSLSTKCVTIRDVLTWAKFMNAVSSFLSEEEAFYHGVQLVFLDSFGCGGVSVGTTLAAKLRREANRVLENLTNGKVWECAENMCTTSDEKFGIPPFYISRGPLDLNPPANYSFCASGPRQNAFRLLRAMQLGKPLLLEGNPGVGKTTIVTALAQASGHRLTRINLSEQTDTCDLFGADFPVEGGVGARFAWRDGAFLSALKRGDWILLDEMNLASQSVLESLNACLDHRGKVYIPELGMSFTVQVGTRFFACQNPLQHGGGRKGLPQSFLNRFTQVYIESLSLEDYHIILKSICPDIPSDVLRPLILFNEKVSKICSRISSCIWEFNLRDIMRWCELMSKEKNYEPRSYLDIIYIHRLRDQVLLNEVYGAFSETFGCNKCFLPPLQGGLYFHISRSKLQIGCTQLERSAYLTACEVDDCSLLLLPHQLPALEALMTCVKMNWMAILVGKSYSGKSSVAHTLAHLTGHKLLEFPMNYETDTTELLGGFEQLNFGRHCINLSARVLDLLHSIAGSILQSTRPLDVNSESEIQYQHVLDLVSYISKQFSYSVVTESCSEKEYILKCLQLKGVLKELEPYSSFFHLRNLHEEVDDEVDAVIDSINTWITAGQFEWVNSVLVQAVKYGHWLLISNANICSPSVLDRLNPLLEPDGVLSVDERGVIDGSVSVIKPHPNFRLFLSMNPVHGEISRSMRNRGIEIFITPPDLTSNHNLFRMTNEKLQRFLSVSSVQRLCCGSLLDMLHEGKNSNMDHQDKDMCSLHIADLVVCPEIAQTVGDAVPIVKFIDDICFKNKRALETCNLHHLHSLLELFTSKSSCEDYKIRALLLESLAAVSPMVEVNNHLRASASATLKVYKEVEIKDGLHMCTNPKFDDLDEEYFYVDKLVLLKNILTISAVVNEHLKVGVSTTPSFLQLSHGAHKGALVLDSLPHVCLVYLQPFLCHYGDALASVVLALDSRQDIEKVQKGYEWLLQFVRVCMLPGCQLHTLCVTWKLCFENCFSPTVPLLLAFQYLSAAMKELHSLDVILTEGKLLDAIRQNIGCPLPSLLPAVSDGKDLISSYDQNLRIPFIKDDIAQKRLELCDIMQSDGSQKSLCEKLLNTEEQQAVSSEGENCPSDVAYVLKTVLISIVKRECNNKDFLDIVSSLTKFCVKLSNVDILKLQPILLLRDSKVCDLKCLFPSVVELHNSILEPEVLEEDCRNLPLDQSFQSHWINRLLPLSAGHYATVENYGEYQEHLKYFHNYLWCFACSPACCRTTSINNEIDYITAFFNHTIVAVYDALAEFGYVSELECETDNEIRKQMLSKITSCAECLSANSVMWELILYHLHTADQQLDSLTEKFCKQTGTYSEDISIRTSLNIVRVHIGIALSTFLCPSSSFDPVAVTFDEYQCHSEMFSQADSLSELYKSNRLPLTPCVRAVHKQSEVYKKKLKELSVPIKRSDGTKFAQIVRECTEMAKTTWSTRKINSLIVEYDGLSINKIEEWSVVARASLQKIKEWTGFPDILVPFVMSMSEVLSALNALTEIATFNSEKNLSNWTLLDLLRFPCVFESGQGHFEWVKFVISFASQDSVKGITKEDWTDEHQKKLFVLALDASLFYLRDFEQFPSHWIESVKCLLEMCWSRWKREDARINASMEKSLYHHRTKRHKIDDQSETDDDIKEMLPVYDNLDEYSEHTGHNGLVEKTSTQFTNEEMKRIAMVFSLVFGVPSVKFEVEMPLTGAYVYAAPLLKAHGWLSGQYIDSSLAGVYCIMCSKQVTGRFARKKSITAIDKVVEVLMRLKVKVKALQEEWPEHPGLQQIYKSCDSVLSLDAFDPVMKILCRVEYLLRKLQEWEAMASTKVSMSQEMNDLYEIVIAWRKQELSCWKDLLLKCKDDYQSAAYKWWFHLYDLSKDAATLSDMHPLLASVVNFVESSTLGDFAVKLHLLRDFSNDLCLKGHNDAGSVLANVFSFYSIFSDTASDLLKRLASPVEESLKNHISSLQWSHKNYWSFKSTCEKSQHVLSKYLKQYKEILDKPVHLKDANVKGSSTCKVSLQKVIDYGSRFAPVASAILHSFDAKTKVETEAGSTSKKFLMFQKRKALASLFKSLKEFGVSYRKGIEYSEDIRIAGFLLPSIHIESLPEFDDDFYISMEKLLATLMTLDSPSKDLTSETVTKMRGYSVALMAHLMDCRKLLSLIDSEVCGVKKTMCEVKKIMDYACGEEIFCYEEYFKHKEVCCISLEQCIDSVKDLDLLCSAIPEDLSLSFTPFTAGAFPPFAFGIQNASVHSALESLKVKVQLLLHQHQIALKQPLTTLVTRADLQELHNCYLALESFVSKVSDVLLTMENDGCIELLQFLHSLRNRVSNVCKNGFKWLLSIKCERYLLCDVDANRFTRMLEKVDLLSKEASIFREVEDCQKLTDVLNMDVLKDVKEYVKTLIDKKFMVSRDQPLSQLLSSLQQCRQALEDAQIAAMSTHRTWCTILDGCMFTFADIAFEGFHSPEELLEKYETKDTDLQAGGFEEGVEAQDNAKSVEPDDMDHENDQLPQKNEKDEDSSNKNAEADDQHDDTPQVPELFDGDVLDDGSSADSTDGDKDSEFEEGGDEEQGSVNHEDIDNLEHSCSDDDISEFETNFEAPEESAPTEELCNEPDADFNETADMTEGELKEEEDAENTEDMDNTEEEHVENVEDMENTDVENSEDVDDVEDVEDGESAEDTEDVDNAGDMEDIKDAEDAGDEDTASKNGIGGCNASSDKQDENDAAQEKFSNENVCGNNMQGKADNIEEESEQVNDEFMKEAPDMTVSTASHMNVMQGGLNKEESASDHDDALETEVSSDAKQPLDSKADSSSENNTGDYIEEWMKYELKMSGHSHTLYEELRKILLPTTATQLRGSFTSGKRLNIRKIINYIASNYQNNRIWLRRTKKNKRDYQILIAVDDSLSMKENNCTLVTYESLALISSALQKLDCGSVGITKFGEAVQELHPIQQAFVTECGAFVLEQLTFAQERTNFLLLLNSVRRLFQQSHVVPGHQSATIQQLLIIISDGRGIFSAGNIALEQSLRHLTEDGIFTIFLILDTHKEDSITEIKIPTFIHGNSLILQSYLNMFPFPYYIVLKESSHLPEVLSKTLKQWFELFVHYSA